MGQKVKAGEVAVHTLGVFQVADVDARNAVEKLATEGVIDQHVQAVDGHGAFVETIVFRDLRLRGTRKWIGRGGRGQGQ
jgi:hypothetical protein